MLTREVVLQGAESAKRTEYELFGVVNHQGVLTSGHYTAFISAEGSGKAKAERRWSFVSDRTIRKASESEVLCSEGYLLFYRRV